MSRIEIVDLKQNVLDDNDEMANKTRDKLKEKGVFLLNLMSSPGAGKTWNG